VHRRGKRLRERLIQKLDAEGSVVDSKVMVGVDREHFAELEGAVLDQLCVNTTITGIVDVLSTVQ
jgi:hypothetical protein